MNRTVTMTLGIGIIITGLMGADYWLKERQRTNIAPTSAPQNVVEISSSESSATSRSISESSTSSNDNTETAVEPTIPLASSAVSSSTVSTSTTSVQEDASNIVVKGSKRKESINIDGLLLAQGLVQNESTEPSLLSLMTNAQAKTMILLRENDRAVLLSWIENDDVQTIVYGIKKALQETFSIQLKDLVDETRISETGVPYDFLHFFDPAIAAEPITLLRVRDRLYEIHTAKNGVSTHTILVDELTK